MIFYLAKVSGLSDLVLSKLLQLISLVASDSRSIVDAGRKFSGSKTETDSEILLPNEKPEEQMEDMGSNFAI